MAYMQIIESTTNWVCPATADYEIICVAGGQGGGVNASGAAGGATSFGSYLTASGTWLNNSYNTNVIASGGMGGYTLSNYGGIGAIRTSETAGTVSLSASINGGQAGAYGIGYGAGGGAKSSSASSYGGGAGKLKTTFVKIEKGTVVNCVIGTGGAASTGTSGGTAGVDGVIVIREV